MSADAGSVERRDRPHLPPQNLEAEEAILGAMIMSSRAIETAVDLGLRDTDFYRPSHQIIYRAILELSERDAVDELTLVNELRQEGRLTEIGGAVAVMSLVERVPAVANARAYAKEVVNQATLRQLVEAGHEIARLGYEHPDDTDALVNTAGELVTELAQQRETSDFVQAADLLGPLYDELTERAEAGGASRGLSTGFADFDALTGGLQASNLIIVAARPAMGKTSWALNVAEHVAMREKKPVALFSLEMDASELVVRVMCSVAKVDQKRIRVGMPHDGDWPLLVDAVGKLMQTKDRLFLDQSSALTPMELRNKCRRLHQRLRPQGGLGLIMIDYLQLMDSGKRADNRQVEISYISRQLKALARELQVPVMALSQLSRAVEARNDKRPMLSDLRESGAIEQDADLVLFLHRPEYYDKDNPELQGKAELIVAKHRNGEVGSVWMGFLAKYTKFVNLERHQAPPSLAAAPDGGGYGGGHGGGYGGAPTGPPSGVH